jgi:glutathione S-transferase
MAPEHGSATRESTMTRLVLVIGNKNYSSWSLRPWLALRMAGLEFDEERIALYEPVTSEATLHHSPTGKVPVLHRGDVTVFESLAICEYAAELAPRAQLWPADATARAHARSISAEMHAGFSALRSALPMNARVEGGRPASALSAEVEAEIARVTAIWDDCRTQFGSGGDFLFGAFTIADAMYAPVVSRFRTYSLRLPPRAQAYAEAVWALAPLREWVAAGAAEPERIAAYEALLAR